jgi:ribosomally synthesized peptide (two-chain TOMM family)
MNVPLSPPAIDGTQHSRALADWYRQRASLFSDDWGTPYDQDGPVTSTPAGPHVLPEVGSNSPPPGGGYLPSSMDFDSFKVVLLAAMAKAWGDAQFRDKLQIDTKTALREIRDYELPWNLGIYLRDDRQATWHAPVEPRNAGSTHTHHQSYWSNEKPHVLTLYLPAKPESELACEPIALAMYNAAGARYPFTCCCDP